MIHAFLPFRPILTRPDPDSLPCHPFRPSSPGRVFRRLKPNMPAQSLRQMALATAVKHHKREFLSDEFLVRMHYGVLRLIGIAVQY